MKIGCDIVSISRIQKSLQSKHFQDRIFNETEILYCLSKHESASVASFAARFAAKEAFAKALGTGLFSTGGIAPKDIWIENNEWGKPILKTSEKVENYLEEQKLKVADVSLSHEEHYAVAVVLLEKI